MFSREQEFSLSAKVLSAQEMQMHGDMPGMKMKAKRETVHDRDASVLAETPDIPNLPFRLDGNVKEFHLIAEPVKQEIVPGKVVDLWGYNGSAPGPTIQVNQGDRVRLIVDNHLPEATSCTGMVSRFRSRWMERRGESGPDRTRWQIRLRIHAPAGRNVLLPLPHGHAGNDGMIGAFVMHPKNAYKPRVDKDFVIILQEYAILPNITVPNSMNMEFNWLTFNGKAGPATTPLLVRHGERVRIRLINLGMDHHPIHLHGHQFVVTGTEGGRQPESTWGPGNTVLVGVAQSRDVEFVANNPGDWMLHCHLPHHMMNQMSSMVGRCHVGMERPQA